jgi:hypothetical protein
MKAFASANCPGGESRQGEQLMFELHSSGYNTTHHYSSNFAQDVTLLNSHENRFLELQYGLSQKG